MEQHRGLAGGKPFDFYLAPTYSADAEAEESATSFAPDRYLEYSAPWFGSRQVLAGRLSVGELLIFLAYLAQLYEPLNQLSHVGSTMSNARAGTRRVLELIEAEPELPEGRRDVPAARSDRGHQPRRRRGVGHARRV